MSDQLDTAVRAYNVPRPQFGILLCLLSMLVFASQDGITKVLVKDLPIAQLVMVRYWVFLAFAVGYRVYQGRSEEHTSELQSLMRISYAVFCLNTKTMTVVRITTH